MSPLPPIPPVTIAPGVACGGDGPLLVIAGTCVIESPERALDHARALAAIAADAGLPLVFKASFDKANRTAADSFRGPGLEGGLRVLADVRAAIGVPVLSDVHDAAQCAAAGRVLDVLQVPAFLCRQTDLLLAAARTGLPVNVKKGQFLAPWDAKNIVDKFRSAGAAGRLLLTERGVTFGYNDLVVDMRSLEVLRSFGIPVVFDAGHSVQLPGGKGDASGGQREFIFPLARAAAAVGVAAFFMEVHPAPEKALSDGPNAVRLRHMPELLKRLRAVDAVAKRARFTENFLR